MNDRINYSQCPGCKSINISKVFEAEDYTVSHEFFAVFECNYCTLRFTQNIPSSQDIVKYYQSENYISHSDTKKGLINRLYHSVRNHTLKSKQYLIEKNSAVQNGSLLDVGAGTGAFANTMQLAGWNVTALEPDETARKNAVDNYKIELQPSENLFAFEENSFDVITMWHVLEHVHALHEYIDAFKKILKDDGLIFLAVPNYTSLDGQHYKEQWAAYDVPRHLYHFSPASMKEIMRQHQFKIIGLRQMWFDSFYVSMLSEKNSTGKNNLIKASWNGFQSNIKAIADPKHCSSVIYMIKKQSLLS